MNESNIPAVVAVFADHPAAELAIDALIAAGFSPDRVGFVTRTVEKLTDAVDPNTNSPELAVAAPTESEDVATGMIAGGMVGGMIAAGLSLLVPGFGPILAGGVLASFFGGTLAGTAVGGLLGALTNLGLSHELAERYEREIHAGRVVVAVKAGARSADAADILARNGGTHIHREADPGVLSHPFST